MSDENRIETLPAEESGGAPAGTEIRESCRLPRRDSRKTILIVEDEPRFGLVKKKNYSHQPHFLLTSTSLAQQIFKTVFQEGLDIAGHVHFHVNNHPDHLILLRGP